MVTKSLDLVDLSIYKRAEEPSTESSRVCKHYPGLLPPLVVPTLTKHKHRKPYTGVSG